MFSDDYYDDKMEPEMDGTYGNIQRGTQFRSKYLKRKPFGRLRVSWRLILIWIFKKQNASVLGVVEFTVLRAGSIYGLL